MAEEYKTKDPRFPTVNEIQNAVNKFVRVECNGRWPEEDWLYISEYWSINVWKDDGKGPRLITAYPARNGVISSYRGIRIPVKKEVKK